MQAYFIAVLVLTSYMTVLWSRNNPLDAVLKFVWFGMSGWSAFFVLQSFGYVLKA